MGRKLKVRIEVTGIADDEVARLVREIARRIDDGRVHGIVERHGRPLGAWAFEHDATVASEQNASNTEVS